jgi:hypothetical protein
VEKPSIRLIGRIVAATGALLIALGVSALSANESIVAKQDDVGPPENTTPMGSFAPGFAGAARWSAVTYATSAGECFDLNADWNGRPSGGIGGCGFGHDVDLLLQSLSVAGADAETVISEANVATPFVLAEGYLRSPGEALLYGVVAGLVDCDCLVTARWADGAAASANAVNGLFVIQRSPLASSKVVHEVVSVVSGRPS